MGRQPPDLEQEALRKAEEKLTAAAAGEGKLVELAEESTRTMLRGLFGALGYTDIEINFDDPPVSGT